MARKIAPALDSEVALRDARNNLLAILDVSNSSDVKPYRRVELEGIAPGSGLRVSEHDLDLHANLVDKDNCRQRLADVAIHP